MANPEAIERHAATLQHKLDERCRAIPYSHSSEAEAEQIAKEVLGDDWEWLVASGIGISPRVMVTRFVGRVDRG